MGDYPKLSDSDSDSELYGFSPENLMCLPCSFSPNPDPKCPSCGILLQPDIKPLSDTPQVVAPQNKKTSHTEEYKFTITLPKKRVSEEIAKLESLGTPNGVSVSVSFPESIFKKKHPRKSPIEIILTLSGPGESCSQLVPNIQELGWSWVVAGGRGC